MTKNEIEDNKITSSLTNEERKELIELRKKSTGFHMICYTALLIYRLLEKLLKNKKYFFTINQILDTLKVMNITNRDNLYYEATYTSSTVLTALNEVFNLELDRKNYLPTTLTKKN